MRKPDFCLCENKGADQLRSYCEADQCLCFRSMDSTIPLLSKSKSLSFEPSSVAALVGLCRKPAKTGFHLYVEDAILLIWSTQTDISYFFLSFT